MRELLRPLLSAFGFVSTLMGLYAIWRGIGEPNDIAFAISVGLVALALRFTFFRHVLAGLSLKITDVPPGEAPLWVREKWVGLTIPLFQVSAKPVRIRTGGVLTGPKGVWSSLLALAQGKTERMTGFLVSAKDAIDLLEARSPEAARWWRENVPHIYRRCRILVFPEEVGTIIDSKSEGYQNGA